MKIVVLDGETISREELNWSKLYQLGEVDFYDRTSKSKIIERAENADVLISNKVVLTAEHFENLPNLKHVAASATGCDHLDIDYLREHDIAVSHVRNYGTQAVVQIAFAHILNFASQYTLHVNDVRAGGWSAKNSFSYALQPISELAGKTLGLIGYGNIARAMIPVADIFGMNVAVWYYKSLDDDQYVQGLEQVISSADYLSLHIPLTEETAGFVDQSFLNKMKESAVLINTARGGLVNEADLAEALNTDRIRGAGLEVLATEPPSVDNPLLTAKNTFITPHNSWMGTETRQRLVNLVCENIANWQSGKEFMQPS